MPVYLLRHACAGDKSAWTGPDAERPLDAVGVQQAERLVSFLASMTIHRILSSPTQRCRQSVEPLAQQRGLPIEPAPELGSNGSTTSLTQLLVALDAGSGLLCTHGERMRPLLAELRSRSVPITARNDDDGSLLAKGTAWRLTSDSLGGITSLEHLAPGLMARCVGHR